MNKYIKFFLLFFTVIIFSFFVSFLFKGNIYAGTCSSLGGSGGGGSICSFSVPVASANCNFGGIVSTIISVLFAIAGLLFFVMIIISGIKMITAGADKEKFNSAKSTLTHAVIGIVIVIASYLILEIILGLLGINISVFHTSGVSIGSSCSI